MYIKRVQLCWFMVHGSWFMVHGSWFMVQWFMVNVFMVHGSWFMVHSSCISLSSRCSFIHFVLIDFVYSIELVFHHNKDDNTLMHLRVYMYIFLL